MFKRRRLQKTDYKQRLALLKSGKPRLVVRRSLNSTRVQIVRYEKAGDTVVAEASSKELVKRGWHGHCGSTPAAYLTGLLAGLKARRAGVSDAVADIGLQTSVGGNDVYAAVRGAIDAGLAVPAGRDALPDAKRVSGWHVAEYAALLKKDQNKYKKQFSAYLKNNLDPEKLPQHFEDIKNKIISEFGEGTRREVLTTVANSDDGEDWEDVK